MRQMKEDKKKEEIDYEKVMDLCKIVEKTAGFTAEKAKHFDDLAMRIYDRTGTLLSPTTLKRIWGYLKEGTVTRRSTYDLLAQYCGWHNFNDFLEGHTPEIESGFLGVKVLNAKRDLKKGDVVKLMWHPSRVCEVKYEGEDRWIVIRSEGTRLSPGDTFRCSMIMSGEPLYLDDLIHEGAKSGIYVCGRRNGVRFTVSDLTSSLS